MKKQYVAKGYHCLSCDDYFYDYVYMPGCFPSTCKNCQKSLAWSECFWYCPNCGVQNESETEECSCGFNHKKHGL